MTKSFIVLAVLGLIPLLVACGNTQVAATAANIITPTSPPPPTDTSTPNPTATEKVSPTEEAAPTKTHTPTKEAPTATATATQEITATPEGGPTAAQRELLSKLPIIGRPPELNNEIWLNSEPLKLADLHDQVVIVEFWTYG